MSATAPIELSAVMAKLEEIAEENRALRALLEKQQEAVPMRLGAIMTVTEVAEEAGVHKATVHRWLQEPDHWLHGCKLRLRENRFLRDRVMARLHPVDDGFRQVG